MKNLNEYLSSIKPHWYLIIGIILIAASNMSISIDILAWVANVPFLIYLSITKGWKSRSLFVLALIAAWSFTIAKIVSPPMTYFMVFLFSIPISLFHLPAYLIWAKFREYKWSFLLFPTILCIMEWVQYTFTPFASWGVAAYSQSNSINIMQFVSIFGMAGLSFLIYWINVSFANSIINKRLAFPAFYWPIITLIIIIIFGSLRIDMGKSRGVQTMAVAAVGTNSTVSGLPLPTIENNEKVVADLLEKTKKAADFGTKMVVWNEASFFSLPENEATWVDPIKSLAQKEAISIVASYVIPISETPFKYENKMVFINAKGDIEFTHLKHQPVAGEPAVKGTKPLQIANISATKTGGVICYDYDYPYLAQEYGKLGVDIVAVPSSDWRGIDPVHSRMAAFRAIEQGHSIIRSTRFGLSAAISPYGDMVAKMSSFDKNNRIMTAYLPAKSIKTIYSFVGDLFIYLCFGFLIFFFRRIF